MTYPSSRAAARLEAHLHRTGGISAITTDPYAAYQNTLLRWMLSTLEAALEDEGVEASAARGVIDRVIYGCIPQPHETVRYQQLINKLTEQAATTTTPMRFDG